jgi:predicted transcriptional regulator of viral defense system
MALPKLYQAFYKEKVFNFSEVVKKFREDKYSEGYLRKRLNDLLRAGYLGSVGARGLYYIIPQGSSREEFVPDKFLIGAKLSPGGIIGYHSALELHGASYSSYNSVYIITQKYFRPFKFQGIKYQAIKGDVSFGIETILREGLKVWVTDRERTIIEGINGLKCVGGLEEYFKSVELFPSIDFDQAIIYLKRFNKKILYAKIGFLLSYFEKRWSFPENCKKEIKAHLGTRKNYLSDKREKARLDKEWKLMIPVRLKSLLEEY